MESLKCINEVCGNRMSVCWKRGWQLKSGAFAVLCLSCGDAYDDSNYCLSFHKEESGWRECKFCNAPIHCGCVASKHLHETLDAGNVCCKKCGIDAEKRLTTAVPNWSTSTSSSSRLGILSGSKQVNLVPQNAGQGPFDLKKNKNCQISGRSLNPPNFRPSILSGPRSSSLKNTAAHFTGYTAQSANTSRLRRADCYIPKMSDLKIVERSTVWNSEIVQLFEKPLTVTDVSKRCRFFVPRIYAKKYFPTIQKGDGALIEMLDIKNRKWEFQLKFMPCNGDRIYYLDGAEPFLVNYQLQPLDIVTFSIMLPSEILVIGYRKVTNIEEFPVNQQSQDDPSAQSFPSFSAFVNEQDPSTQSLSSCCCDSMFASDSVEYTPENVEEGEIASNKRARKGKETMISTISSKDGQRLLFPAVSRNHVVVIVDDIEEYVVPPVIRTEPKAEPIPDSTLSHRGCRCGHELQVPINWDWGRLHLGSTSGSTSGFTWGSTSGSTLGSAQLSAEAYGEVAAQLPAEIQEDDDLEFSDSEGIIEPGNYLK